MKSTCGEYIDAQMAVGFFLDDINSDSDRITSTLATSVLHRRHQHGHVLRKGAALKPLSCLSGGNISRANDTEVSHLVPCLISEK